MSELYVYYKVPARHQAQARQEVSGAHLRMLARWPLLRPRLLRREDGAPDRAAGDVTWMEIYTGADGLSCAQCVEIRATMAGLPSQRVGPRHWEQFTELNS